MPPSSWADGTRVLVGEDAIDFDMTLKSMDAAAKTALVDGREGREGREEARAAEGFGRAVEGRVDARAGRSSEE